MYVKEYNLFDLSLYNGGTLIKIPYVNEHTEFEKGKVKNLIRSMDRLIITTDNPSLDLRVNDPIYLSTSSQSNNVLFLEVKFVGDFFLIPNDIYIPEICNTLDKLDIILG